MISFPLLCKKLLQLLGKLKELQNYNRKQFLCPPQKQVKTQQTCHIKPSIYIQKTKFASLKQDSSSLLQKCKEDSYRPKHTTRFLLSLKRNDSQTFKKRSCEKPFLQSVIGTTCFDECFLFYVIIGSITSYNNIRPDILPYHEKIRWVTFKKTEFFKKCF